MDRNIDDVIIKLERQVLMQAKQPGPHSVPLDILDLIDGRKKGLTYYEKIYSKLSSRRRKVSK